MLIVLDSKNFIAKCIYKRRVGIYKSVKRSPSHLEDDSAALKRSGKHGKHGSLSFGFWRSSLC